MSRISMMFSGSSGNCTYIQSGETAILIDAGVSAKKISEALCERGIDTSKISGIFITHEHIDHVRGLSVLSRCCNIPVFINEPTLHGAEKAGCVFEPSLVRLTEVRSETQVGDLRVTSFSTMHDANCSVGYTVVGSDDRKIGYATDLGVITDEVDKALFGSEAVILESNHDVGMLRNGDYPYFLKMRILGEYGHLSNDECANQAVRLAMSGTTRFILGHLSRENNRPSVAYKTVCDALNENGLRENYDYELECAPPSGGEIHVF